MPSPSADELIAVIHKKCLDCCGNSRREVQRCNVQDCPLRPYRMNERKPPKRDKRQVSVFDYMKGKTDTAYE